MPSSTRTKKRCALASDPTTQTTPTTNTLKHAKPHTPEKHEIPSGWKFATPTETPPQKTPYSQ